LYFDLQKETFQNQIPKLLPQISTVLAHVDRQMLLLFKTNDLLRGIEHTLRTHGRRAALLAMASRCVNTEYQEQKREALGNMQRSFISLCQMWATVRIKVWYWMLCFQDYFGLA
jgi:aarF domain-containing kinase